jgi:hypothetical protein
MRSESASFQGGAKPGRGAQRGNGTKLLGKEGKSAILPV